MIRSAICLTSLVAPIQGAHDPVRSIIASRRAARRLNETPNRCHSSSESMTNSDTTKSGYAKYAGGIMGVSAFATLGSFLGQTTRVFAPETNYVTKLLYMGQEKHIDAIGDATDDFAKVKQAMEADGTLPKEAKDMDMYDWIQKTMGDAVKDGDYQEAVGDVQKLIDMLEPYSPIESDALQQGYDEAGESFISSGTETCILFSVFLVTLAILISICGHKGEYGWSVGKTVATSVSACALATGFCVASTTNTYQIIQAGPPGNLDGVAEEIDLSNPWILYFVGCGLGCAALSWIAYGIWTCLTKRNVLELD